MTEIHNKCVLVSVDSYSHSLPVSGSVSAPQAERHCLNRWFLLRESCWSVLSKTVSQFLRSVSSPFLGCYFALCPVGSRPWAGQVSLHLLYRVYEVMQQNRAACPEVYSQRWTVIANGFTACISLLIFLYFLLGKAEKHMSEKVIRHLGEWFSEAKT